MAGGTESMSFVPMGGHKISINPWLESISGVVPLHGPDRRARGAALRHRARGSGPVRAAPAIRRRSRRRPPASSSDEIVPVPVDLHDARREIEDRRPRSSSKSDEGPRADTSLEALAKLKPAFHAKGTVTAGNSSQTSDGAAAAVVMSAERARAALGIKPLARFVAYAYAGCLPEEMGIGPVHAIPKALEAGGPDAGPDRPHRTERGLRGAIAGRHQDAGPRSGQGERQRRRDRAGPSAGLHRREADRQHPPGAEAPQGEYGMVTMCVGGGMGAAGIFENLN